VRTVQHAQPPVVAVFGHRPGGQCCGRFRGFAGQVQHVAGPQHTPAVAADAAQRERRTAAHHQGCCQSPAHQQVAAHPRTLDVAHLEHLAAPHRNGGPMRQGLAVEMRRHPGPGQRDHGVGVEAQRRAGDRQFQPGGLLRVAEETVPEAEREAVHRARRRYADVPVPCAARPVLQRRLGPGIEHVDAVGMVAEVSQRSGGLLPAQEYRVHGHLPQVAQVGLQALQVGGRQCRLQAGAGGIAVGGMHDELGDHRVVEGRDLAAALDPGIHPHVVREPGLGQQAGGGLEVLARILGIDPRLDRMAPRGPRAQGLQGGSSPAAASSIHSTRSTPVTSSVTPCSTCSRVFTSRK
jgi:hypothetical protein